MYIFIMCILMLFLYMYLYKLTVFLEETLIYISPYNFECFTVNIFALINHYKVYE